MSQGFSTNLLTGSPQTALVALQQFEWLTASQKTLNHERTGDALTFAPPGLNTEEIWNQIDDIYEKEGRVFSEDEEREFAVREFRSRVMKYLPGRLLVLAQLADRLIQNVTEAGGQQLIGQLAQLRHAGMIGPSESIHFLTEPLPNGTSGNLSSYQHSVGGNLVLGARLLWWCAAGVDPKRYGYSDDHFKELSEQPFWFRYEESANERLDGSYVCYFEDYPLELIRAAAQRIVAALPILRTDAETSSKTAAHNPPRVDGFDSEGKFWRNGKCLMAELTPQQLNILKVLYDKPGRVVGLEEFCLAVFELSSVNSGTLSGALSNFNTAYEGIGMRVKKKNAFVHLVLEEVPA